VRCFGVAQHQKGVADAMIEARWTYTKTKLLAKFGAPQPAELAA